jgi:hypothetical protein
LKLGVLSFVFSLCIHIGSNNSVLNVYQNETVRDRVDGDPRSGIRSHSQDAHCGAGNGPGIKNYSVMVVRAVLAKIICPAPRKRPSTTNQSLPRRLNNLRKFANFPLFKIVASRIFHALQSTINSTLLRQRLRNVIQICRRSFHANQGWITLAFVIIHIDFVHQRVVLKNEVNRRCRGLRLANGRMQHIF